MRREIEDDGGVRNEMKTEATGQAKKSYHSPRLVVYGDLRRLTMAKGGNRSDFGAPKTRTVGAA
jgi:hypothetical protein